MNTHEVDLKIAEWIGLKYRALRHDGFYVEEEVPFEQAVDRYVRARYTRSKDALQPVLERLGQDQALRKAYIHAEYKQFSPSLEGRFYDSWELMWYRRTLSAEQISRAVVEVIDV